MSEANHKSNRLIHEPSPYLQQHAHNPVDWYPWGNDALTKAKQESKPIFLSVGYSACHWCQVGTFRTHILEIRCPGLRPWASVIGAAVPLVRRGLAKSKAEKA